MRIGIEGGVLALPRLEANNLEANNNDGSCPLGVYRLQRPRPDDRHRIKRINKFAAACETNLVCFAGYSERAA